MDIQEKEKLACVRAGKAGGEYLDSIGKYDLSKLSKEEWDTFVQCICMDFMIPF